MEDTDINIKAIGLEAKPTHSQQRYKINLVKISTDKYNSK